MDSDHVETKKKIDILQSSFIRRTIIASYWVVVLLAVPLWWSTTSLERLPLPALTGLLESSQIVFPLNIHIDARELINDHENFVNDVGNRMLNLFRERGVSDNFRLNLVADTSYHIENQYRVIIRKGSSDRSIRGSVLSFGAHSLTISEAAEQLASSLTSLMIPNAASKFEDNRIQHVVQYAPRFRLSFSLLNENSASGSSIFNWDIREAISYLTPAISRLSSLHHFTIESQVQFYAPLSFSPLALDKDSKAVQYGLTTEDLTIFINSAEWTLSSSVSNDPVLHFVIFVPSREKRPLQILDDNGNVTSSSAFIVPQWGGIVIYNPDSSAHDQISLDSRHLRHSFSIFQTQLLSLVGLPILPTGISMLDSISSWQLDALRRQRILENVNNAKETLISISKLVDQIDGMPVGKGVQDDIQDSITALQKVPLEIERSSQDALAQSSKAFTLASRAFFNPGMLAMLYFPAEHKLAVYAPLFAPIAVPLILSVVREVRDWRALQNIANRPK